MNFQTLKTEFIEYLEQVQEKKPWKHYKTDSDNVSIFLYADEFKDYIKTVQGKYGIDPSVCNESVEEILKMQFVDGKLVTQEEAQEENIESDGKTLKDSELDGDDEVKNNNNGNEAPGLAESENEEAQLQEVDKTEASNPTVTNESTQNYADENDVNMENPEIITGVLNDLLTDELFVEVLDTDGDGKISDEELKAFLDVVKCYDEDPDSISLNDLMAAASDIQSGMFKFATDEEVKEIIGETPQADAAGLTSPQGASGGGGFSVPQSYQQNIPKYDESGNAILENFTKEELTQELEVAKADLSEKQAALESIENGTNEVIQGLQKNVDDAYKAYQEQLEEKDAQKSEKLDELKTDTDTKQKALDDNNLEISKQTNIVNECQVAYENAKSTRASLESQLSTLNSANEGDLSDEKSAELNQKIDALKAKIKEAEQKEKDAFEKLTQQQGVLSNLEEKSVDLEKNLEDAKKTQSDYEAELLKEYPELQEYYDAYNKAKEELETQKASLTESAKQDLQKAQDYVSKVSSALNEAQTNEDIKENYSFGNKGEDMIEFANTMLGFSEGQVESKCGYNLPDGLWCAAFCKYVATEVYGDELPDWYTNCNYNSCSEILAAANNNNAAFKDSSQAQPGDFIIFNTSRGTARHIGMVVSVNSDGTVTTIEGNTSSKVGIRTYSANDTGRINSYVRVN